MNPDFEKWLETEHGLKCNDETKQPIKKPCLTNRLYWAFEAGTNYNPQFQNMKDALIKSYKRVGELRKEVAAKNRLINQLKEKLQNETMLRAGV